MYYLTYRPQTLSQLDNIEVREQLAKILASPQIPHAFLFAGPKGTGKTSTARILAKELNGPESAQAIAKGTSPDVIEMDGASNRKIDDIRALIAELKFSPLTSKYKIYIIDEVHMLTKEAFNALLKSLEEPPASTIFILATTEADSLPATIASRCMIVTFSQAKNENIISMLKRISTGEKLTFSDDIIQWIANHADGSFRDAAKLLETAVVQGITSVDDLQKITGQTWQKGDLIQLVDAGKKTEALQWIVQSAQAGAQFKLLIEDLLSTLHAHLLHKNGIEVPAQYEYTLSIKECAFFMSLLQKAYGDMKYSPIQSLPLELAIVEFMETYPRKN